MIAHIFLALACLGLLLVIAAQDWLYKPLRNDTISAGLTGPYHVMLDAAYVPVAAALCLAFHGHLLMQILAVISAIALLLVATTNTAGKWVDSVTGGKHSLWHSRFTLVVFVAAFVLQVVGDHGRLWVLTGLNVVVPGIAYAYFHFRKRTVDGVVVAASPAAEKLYVLGLCIWLIIV
ncbi:MAG: hypothetical protein ACREBW_05770 [Candidatus Micrarchaeaceae archaeon]